MSQKRLMCKAVKSEVKPGTPFFHADKTWYVKDHNGTFRKLIPMGDKLFYKNGDLFGDIPKPPKPKVRREPTIEERVKAAVVNAPVQRAEKSNIIKVG